MIRLLRFCMIMLYELSSEGVHWVIWICFDLHLPAFVISSFCLRVSCVSFLSCGCSAVCWTLTISFVLICHTVPRFMLSLWSCRGCSCLGELRWVFSWFFRVGQVVLSVYFLVFSHFLLVGQPVQFKNLLRRLIQFQSSFQVDLLSLLFFYLLYRILFTI